MVMISILDQTLIFDDTTPAETLQQSIVLAQAAERLGYLRFWVVEYHSCGMIASASPEILLATIGAYTSRLRLGAGAVLLPHYSPLKVAENFRMLQALYPDRIDLCIGRNLGGLSQTCYKILNPQGRAETIEIFTTKAQEVIGFLDNNFPTDHPYQSVPAVPEVSAVQELWMMSSHANVAQVAGEQGLTFCLAHFVTSIQDSATVAVYREHFRPGRLEKPYVAVSVQVFCADSDEEALDLNQKYCLLMMHKSQKWQAKRISFSEIRYPSAQEVASYQLVEGDQAFLEHGFPIIAGNRQRVKEQLEKIGEIYGADELMITTISPDARASLHSYELIAEAFNLIA